MAKLEKIVVRDEQGKIDRKKSMVKIINSVPTNQKFWSTDVVDAIYGEWRPDAGFAEQWNKEATGLCNTFVKVTAEKSRKLVRISSKETRAGTYDEASPLVALFVWREG